MKKLLLIALLFLTGCNAQIIDLNYKFNRAYIELPDGTVEVEVLTWKDYEDSDMVQVTAVDGTIYYTHGSKIILINDEEDRKEEWEG